MNEALRVKEEIPIIPLVKNPFTEAEKYLSDKYDFRNNVVSCEIEYRKKGIKKFIPVDIDSIYRELQRIGNKLSMANLITMLKSDFVLRYDPFHWYFKKLPLWDKKTDWIGLLASYVHTVDSSFSYHLEKHIVRTIACALNDNYFNKHALILVHPKQGSGKTTFMRFLCPPTLKDYIAEDISTDKDSRILLAKNLLINLDELALLSKKDINQLKAFISKNQINERLPYDRKNSILPRRASFVGSTNQTEFLNDETGSVRWLCFEIIDIDFSYSEKINIDLVYAQGYHLYKSKEFNYNLTKEEIQQNEDRNRKHQILTLERELIQRFFIPGNIKDENFITASEIETVINDQEPLHKLNYVQIGKALKSLSYPEGRDKYQRRGYYAIRFIETTNLPAKLT